MAQEENGFKPNFKNGGFWEYYKDLERQFEDFLVYIPYLEKNEKACSFRLVNILLGICSHIDSAIKEIAFYEEFNGIDKWKKIRKIVVENRTKIEQGKIPSGPSFKMCLEALEYSYCVSTKEVTFKRLPNGKIIKPYEPFNQKTQAPFWWDIYNHTKHDLHEYFEKVTLKQTRDALAGAFLLNVIFEPATYRLAEYGLVKYKYSRVGHVEKALTFYRGKCMKFKGVIEPDYAFDCIIETPLFIYEYEYERNEKT